MDSRFYSKAILQTELCFFPGPLGGWLKLKTIFRSKWTYLQLIKCLERRAKLELLLKKKIREVTTISRKELANLVNPQEFRYLTECMYKSSFNVCIYFLLLFLVLCKITRDKKSISTNITRRLMVHWTCQRSFFFFFIPPLFGFLCDAFF